MELVEEREDRHFGVTIALYRLGATQLLDRQFAWELVFWDEQLHSISLTLEEGEDLAAFYQELEEGLADRFGLEDFKPGGPPVAPDPAQRAAYDQVNTSMAASDSGETTLTLTGLFQGDALVQLACPWQPTKTDKTSPLPRQGANYLHDLGTGQVAAQVDPQQHRLPGQQAPAQVGRFLP